jgi:hypothetical protein
MADEQITTEAEPEVVKPPRVAIICSRRIVTDYSLYLKFLLVGLADESVPVLLVCPPGLNVESVVPPAFEVVSHPAVNIPLTERYSRKLLLDRLIQFEPMILHCLCESRAALTRWLARHLNIPYLLNIDSISRPWHPVTISQTRCARIITPAKTVAAHFTAVHPKFADRVSQINIGTFVPDETACFAHPERVPGIVIAQPLADAGELDNLFHALHRLTVENYQFMVALIGAGDAEKKLRKLLISLGLLRVVTIMSSLPAIEPALAAADIFIVPRPPSSFSMSMLSAMSAGCAVAACKGEIGRASCRERVFGLV